MPGYCFHGLFGTTTVSITQISLLYEDNTVFGASLNKNSPTGHAQYTQVADMLII